MPPRVKMIHAKPKPPPAPRKPTKTPKSSNQSPNNKNELSANTNPNIHRDRAKRWGTNPWVAEWFANAVEYLNPSKAQKDFETWVFRNFQAEEASTILKGCKDPPAQRNGSYTGNAKLWNSAASWFEGVSDTAMKYYHRFTAENNLVEPVRIKPAASRKRGENSSSWLAVTSLLDGCQVPDIDLEEARRIAISQLDETKDIYEAWHTDCDYFMNSVIERAQSTVPVPEAEENMKDPIMRDLQLRTDAYRSKMHLMHLSRALWTLAVSLFEEFERRGLQRTSAIEAAYNADPQLKWQIVGVAAMTVTYASKIAARANQVLAALPAFSKYFKKYRTMQGVLCIDVDHAYIRAHPYPRNSIDELIVQVISSKHGSALDFALSQIKDHLGKFPKEALKFDDVAWREIGEYIVVAHFSQEICSSHFGRRLHQAAIESKTMTALALDMVYEQVSFMNRSELSRYISPRHDYEHWNYGLCRGIVEGMAEAWLDEIFNPDLTGDIINYHLRFNGYPGFNNYFDKSWREADECLWEKARKYDPPGKGGKGKVAQLFGLYDVQDRNRPCWASKRLLLTLEDSQHSQNLPMCQNLLRITRLSLRFRLLDRWILLSSRDMHSLWAQVRMRTLVDRLVVVDEPKGAPADALDEEEIPVPELLPGISSFQRRFTTIFQTFQRILENDDNLSLAPDAPKKGPSSLGGFREIILITQAMKRVGFDIVQTVGSSVRFDPRAKTARPITFIGIGSRLNRYYGWTTATFLLAPSNGSDES
ncbi:hypothetical protein BT96DRAFT_916330 [Gymnopus androsaceus JB14]|uniref:Uncharacterized protein n=1 Tax=Gymnopus androsaceus JB14 TaxID=1447944 RepID=A0A6A4I3Q4_9AGAR|nr:hypothetical protein BT96DRAFT_916330 [Gymnopus androsaceus JB14]